MILLIDNYDSFSYNLYQLIGSINPNVRVIRNDALTVSEIGALNPERIIISPGPGWPREAGVCIDVIRTLGAERGIPILGVCLGHQAICEAFGATIRHAKKLMHGKQSAIRVNDPDTDSIFKGCSDKLIVARYHSLVAEESTLPDFLTVTARSLDDSEVMSVRHKHRRIYGLQFHPESILTPSGKIIMENFMKEE